MAFKFNGTNLNTVTFNGTKVCRVFFNGVQVFQRSDVLYLPARASWDSGTINLAQWIATQPLSECGIITVINNYTQPRIVSGNLCGYNSVTLINNGEIQGNAPGATALSIWPCTDKKMMKLINNGWIRGAGGNGGKGGKGHVGDNYTTGSTSSETRYNGSNNWYVTCAPFPGSRDVRVYIKWDGSQWVAQDRASPCSSQITSASSGGCTYYRSSLKSGDGTCDGDTYDYYAVKKVCNTTKTYYGGEGGEGGNGGTGQYYKVASTGGDPGHIGAPGGHPEETRGYTGGHGGAGGTWGNTGTTGSRGEGYGDYGEAGGTGGLSISGTDNLEVGSILGNRNGDTVP